MDLFTCGQPLQAHGLRRVDFDIAPEFISSFTEMGSELRYRDCAIVCLTAPQSPDGRVTT